MFFGVDDTFHTDPRARTSELAALGLWTLAGSFAGQHLTDGHVPAWWVDTVPRGKRLARLLVTAGLWEEVEDGWRFRDWTGRGEGAGTRNPLAQEVRDDRRATAERQERWRQSRRNESRNALRNGSSNGSSNALRNGSSNGSSNALRNDTPTRPDPKLLLVAVDGEVEVPYRESDLNGWPS